MSGSATRAWSLWSVCSRLAFASGVNRTTPRVNQVTLAELPIAFGDLELSAFLPVRADRGELTIH